MNIRGGKIIPNLTPPLGADKIANSRAALSDSSLGNSFDKMLSDVNNMQINAEHKQQEFIVGEKKDIHGTMIAMEKADVALRLLVQVKNKLTSAYEEIMRMQI